MTSEITRTPEIIAGEINSIKSQTSAILGAAFAVARQSCFEIGKRLEEAKCLVAYGQWGAWLSENVAYSESTANNLMRIYREFGDEQIDMLTGKCPRDVFGDLSQSQLVELFALPPAERITYVEEHREEMEGQSVRELKRQIAEYKAASERDREKALNLGALLTETRAALTDAENDLTDAEAQLKKAKAELQKKAHEKVETTVIVNQPSEEQIEQLRADIGAEYEADYKAKLAEAEAEADKLHEADRQKLEKLAAKYEKELEEAREEARRSGGDAEARIDAIRADYEKRLRAANLQGNVRQARISLYLSDIARLLGLICDDLDGMEREEPGTGVRLRASVAVKLDRVLSERGLTV